MVAFVPQRASWDCGIACLAMVTGLTYDVAAAALGPRANFAAAHSRLPSGWMPRFLGQHGLATRQVHLSPEWWLDLQGVRLANVGGHYVVVLPDNTVHDPQLGPYQSIVGYPRAFHCWEIHYPNGAAHGNR